MDTKQRRVLMNVNAKEMGMALTPVVICAAETVLTTV
tara:strand:- start:292 stop:402 length:111 start_codon:yes stop_codon:yes gene_type:complete